jgi:tRNA pseudouridine38-40 synthase
LKNYKLILEYNGSGFAGSQTQNEENPPRTVQAELEKALQIYFRSPTAIKTNFAGRTDTGVHAVGQVVNFLLEDSLINSLQDFDPENNPHKILISVNGILPADMAVTDIREMPPDFNARFSAKAREYLYKIFIRRHRPVLRVDSLHWEKEPLDFESMARHATSFVGKHDFKNYCKIQNGYHEDNFFCTVIKSELIKESDICFKYRIKADRFLRHMVRKIVAELIAVGKGQKIDLQKHSAPASGLTLLSIEY